MNLHPFVNAVSSLRFDNCFNPYSDRCEVHDHDDAPGLRAAALSRIIYIATQEPVDSIWVGRDLGFRGGRRTGLALTDDVHIDKHVERWNLTAKRPTIGKEMPERTAAAVWRMLDKIEARIFLWNVFPLHPHAPGEPFTNRQHNASERRAGEEVLCALIALLSPARIIAIGNDAAAATQRIVTHIPVHCVRHPSYGGQNQFFSQIRDLYKNPSQTIRG